MRLRQNRIHRRFRKNRQTRSDTTVECTRTPDQLATRSSSKAALRELERSASCTNRIEDQATAASSRFQQHGAQNVISGSEAVSSGAHGSFPIDASLQSLRFSLDDGRGNRENHLRADNPLWFATDVAKRKSVRTER